MWIIDDLKTCYVNRKLRTTVAFAESVARASRQCVSRVAFLHIASRVAAVVMCLTFALCVACKSSAKLLARFTSWRLQGKLTYVRDTQSITWL